MTTTRLKQVRERRGLAAAALAEAAGVARQTVYAIESGSFVPNTTVALQLARALDVPVEQIFTLAGEVSTRDQTLRVETIRPVSAGQLVSLCRVGARLVAAPADTGGAWLPDADATVTAIESGVRASVCAASAWNQEESGLLVAGCDPAIGLLTACTARAAGVRLKIAASSSRQALDWLKAGKVHLAGLHLRDPQTGEFNLPFIRRTFPRGGYRIIHFASWEQGFVVAVGNPLRIRTVADLARRGVRMVNREEGAGSRELLDRMLREAGLNSSSVRGYQKMAPGQLAAARAVQAGLADCCIANRAAARALGLDFVPLAVDQYDLVTLDRYSSLPAVTAVFDTLNRSELRKQLAAFAGYNTSQTGAIV